VLRHNFRDLTEFLQTWLSDRSCQLGLTVDSYMELYIRWHTVDWLLSDVVYTTELLFDKATCFGIASRHQASASDTVHAGETQVAMFALCSTVTTPHAALLLHHIQHCHCTTCSTDTAPHTALLLHHIQHCYCTTYSTVTAPHTALYFVFDYWQFTQRSDTTTAKARHWTRSWASSIQHSTLKPLTY
jgi:hypothetical protein